MAFNDPINLPSPASLDLPDVATVKATGALMEMPCRIGLKADGSDLWLLPIEPLVSVRAANQIVRRGIAKRGGQGSIKEVWSQDDYQIGIVGLFIGADDTRLPEEDISRLNALLTARKPLIIACRLLDILGINQMVVEQWEYVPTSGINNQQYQFSGYSDYNFELF